MARQLHIKGLLSSAEELWQEVLEALHDLPVKRSQEEWLRGSHAVHMGDGELTIEVPHKFAKEFMDRRCRQAIEDAVGRVSGSQVRIRFVIADAADGSAADSHPRSQPPEGSTEPSPRRGTLIGAALNSRYRFDSFVVAEANQFACATAQAVAAAPGAAYNPLFLHGGVGMGKTHLLQAIAHEIIARHPRLVVAYTPADNFTFEFVSAIREHRCDAFRKRYRGADVLLVDDVQFLSGKERTEEEFLLTFAALQESGRQIVVSSDRSPKELHLTDPRLRSRFESGVIAEVRMADTEARMRILRRKAAAEGAAVDDDVLLCIASMVQSDVRSLEGALIKLLAYSSLTRRELTESLARDVLEGYYGKSRPSCLTLERIQSVTCRYFNVEQQAVLSKRRDRAVALPRQVAMYLARELTHTPLAQIGASFGGRDHSTVVAACSRIRDGLATDPALQEAVAEISRLLQECEDAAREQR